MILIDLKSIIESYNYMMPDREVFKIFNRSINYSYTDIENELKDRIIFE